VEGNKWLRRLRKKRLRNEEDEEKGDNDKK